jgi:tetratricopeptide (TPR) repeat protein
MFRLGPRSLFWLAAIAILALGVGRRPPAQAQSSDIELEWRLLTKAQAAHARGRAATEHGERAVAESELARAADLYRQLLDQNPLRRDLYAPLADTLIRRGNAAAAYALLIQQTLAGNKDKALQLQLVRALQGMHRHRNALQEAQKLAQTDPKNPVLQALLGDVAAEAGESELAIKVLGQVLLLPLSPSALSEAGLNLEALRLLRARLLLSAKRPTEAATALSGPANEQQPEALFLLGQAQLDSGRLDEAVEALRRCVAVSATGPQPLHSRATALLAQVMAKSGHTTEAIAVLRQAGEDPTVLLALARLYLSDQPPNPAAALMVVERAAKSDPRDQLVCLQRASLLQQTAQKEEALSEFSRCSTLLAPADTGPAKEALTLLADVELRLGRLDEGIAHLRSILGQQKGDAELTKRLAQALLRRGLQALPSTPFSTQALADLEEAHKLSPTSTTAQSWALGLLAAGKPSEALVLLSPLCEKNPKDPRLLGACGHALLDNQHPEQALPVLQQAEAVLNTGPPNPPLRAALRQEQAAALIALARPLDALKLLERNDPTALRTRAQAFLAAVRAFYASPNGAMGEKGTTRRGPFPPLRVAGEPLEAPASAGASPTLAQGLNDEHQVLYYAQAALRSLTLSQSERGEAMLYQVVSLFHRGEFPLALRLMAEIAVKIDASTLDALLGPGGFLDLKARIMLRTGDFYAGVGLAQQALTMLPPKAARALQDSLTVSYTSKAIEVLERNEIDRANTLLRSAWMHAHGGPPENLARANYNMAVMQLERGKLEDARAALTRLDPQLLPEVWLGLGSYHDLLGDGPAALEAYRHYLQVAEPVDPQLPRVRQWVDVLERIHEGVQP